MSRYSFGILLLFLSIIFAASVIAQPVKRLLGSQGFDLDDNAHHHIFITDNNGGIGIDSTGHVTLGFPNSCSILDISSTTHGVLIPRLTTAQEMGVCGGTPPEGMLMYNTTTHTFDVYNGSSWGGSWITTGNTGNTIDNTNNLLGTTAASPVKPINIVIGGNRIVRYETNNCITGGFAGNSISGSSNFGVIAGGGSLGFVNTITAGDYGTIGGGGNNIVSAQTGTIAGGGYNQVLNLRGTVGGGAGNTASGQGSFIGGGENGTALGANNTAFGAESAILGGQNNNANGNFSSIAGGSGLTLGMNSFGYNTSDASANPSANTNIAYFGNVNMWLGNTNGVAQQLRFYGPNVSTTYSGSLFTSFQASSSITGTTQYALPTDYGSGLPPNVPPYVLADITAAGTPRQLSWQSVNSLGWSLGGNSGTSPATNFLGTTDNVDFVIRTQSNVRATFAGTPSAVTPMLALQNTTPGIQGVRINGSIDAVTGNTLAGNPGVWDLVVDGDEVVTGVLKTGGSMWFDGNSPTHSITADKPLSITTTTNDSIMFGTNGSTKVTIASNGFVGIGTMNPQSPLHISGSPAVATNKDATGYFYIPDPANHVLTVENNQTNGQGNGIAIVIHNPASSNPITDGQFNNEGSNYLTFYNDNGDHNHIKGRVEGFSYQNFNDMVAAMASVENTIATDLLNPFSWLTFNVGFDTHFMDNTFDTHFMDNSFNSHFLDNIFSTPSLGLCDLYIPLPDGIPNVDLGNILPCSVNLGIDLTQIQSPICFSCISSPINFGNIQPPLTNLTNPVSLNTSIITNLLDQIKALPYKQKIIDIVSNGPKAAVVKAAATYAMAFFAGGVTYESGSGDYAEWLERADHNENIAIGDVVGVTGGKISKNTNATSQFMVASWKPCVLGNMPDEGKEQFFNKVAFMGQVPVRLYGPVKKGDYIVPSGRNDGFARAIPAESINASDLDKVLGVAWQDDEKEGPTMVKIAVGLKPHEMVKVIQDQAQKIEDLQEKVLEIDELKAEVAQIKSQMHPVHSAKYSKKKAKHSTMLSSR